MKEVLGQLRIDAEGVLVDPLRPTTVKQRLLGGTRSHAPHHMLRLDRESTAAADETLAEKMRQYIARRLPEANVVAISDYNKGACVPKLIANVVALARAAGVPVIADPGATSTTAATPVAPALHPTAPRPRWRRE